MGNLNTLTLILCGKELYSLGEISKEEYIKSLYIAFDDVKRQIDEQKELNSFFKDFGLSRTNDEWNGPAKNED